MEYIILIHKNNEHINLFEEKLKRLSSIALLLKKIHYIDP
jgi:hypothetical protein